ncbi:MBL fold metallo-hydrolase [Sphingomonas bisphenolicum]|uniref:MBL fold metallo-hydrolase n=1 Tax=Sphingomonas bisphenolicum TaxID=296544 RepID=A0ABN5WQ55_9SPHN|nr:MBL fold metallo-hydrolase [Sphingomonas bisphenolicum]BBF71687.1 MBL fold metallo-hydrolase [Sphingomonas bisphenolicum]
MSVRITCAALSGVLAMLATAAAAGPPRTAFVTLGTMGGPVPDGHRSQPANAIVRDGKTYLVDTGDGTVEQMARAGLPLPTVRAIFLSHLHVDHIGGLAAILGLRNQTEARDVLAIYGPPGTRELVAGLVAGLQPSAKAGYGIPGKSWTPPENTVSVIELRDGETIDVDDMKVGVAQNTHYDFAPGSVEDRNYKSFALRFDLPDRSIAYTGDTGPSAAVERLASGADLLVSEMIDMGATMDRVARTSPNMPASVKATMVQHLTTHHLTPEEVGALAARAKVKAVTVTHMAGGTPDAARTRAYVATIGKSFTGPVAIANDLDRF